MNWDIERLYKTLIKIKKLLYSDIDEELRRDLLWDKYNIESLIKYSSEPKSSPELCPDMLSNFSDSNNKREVMLRLASSDEIRNLILNINCDYVPIGSFFVKRIPEIKYMELVYDFFREFDPRIVPFMDEMIKDKRVLFSTKKHERTSVLGECTPIMFEDKSYVSSRFNGFSSTLDIFPHEIGHAFQQKGHINYEDTKKYCNSLFTEVYSEFIGFAFLDYLKTKGYDKISRAALSGKFLGMFSQLEFLIPEISGIPYSKIENGMFIPKSKTSLGLDKISFTAPSCVYSNLFATRLFDIYKKDKDSGMQEVEKFKNKMLYSTDCDILDTYTPEELTMSLSRVVRNTK